MIATDFHSSHPSSPRFYRDTWLSIFQRKGGVGLYTNDWRRLLPWQRNIVLAHDRHFNGVPDRMEEAVLGSIESEQTWFALSTTSLHFRNSVNSSVSAKPVCIPISQLKSARMDFTRMMKSRIGKAENRLLKIEIYNSAKASADHTHTCTLMLEPGLPFCGIWNVLVAIASKNSDNRQST